MQLGKIKILHPSKHSISYGYAFFAFNFDLGTLVLWLAIILLYINLLCNVKRKLDINRKNNCDHFFC